MIKKVKELWNKCPRWIRNKYTLTAVIFFFYMLFFDQNDLISQAQLRMELEELEDNKAYFKVQIEETREDLNDLLTNDENLEKFAREKYLMKMDNEEIFVIVEEE
ncbi:septum formation initiator family protein [bacterium SCSIO 12741]|nr:septum formation initiator family protein [bacterium SCSIO 12741]